MMATAARKSLFKWVMAFFKNFVAIILTREVGGGALVVEVVQQRQMNESKSLMNIQF